MFSQSKPHLRSRTGCHGGAHQAWQDGLQIEAPVEPILTLGQVTMGVFSEVEGMIGPRQGGLHVARHGVDPGKTRHVHTAPDGTDHFRHMNRAGLLNAREAVQSIAEHSGSGAQIAFRPVTNRLFAKAGDRIEACDLGMAVHAQLDRRHKGHLILRATPGLALAFPAEVGIIHDHRTLQDPSRLVFGHNLHQLVLDPPGGGVAHAELALQLQRRNAVFRLTDQEHRLKPGAQRQLGTMKDGPRTQARQRSTAAALPISGSLNIKVTMAGCAAVRAVIALWPARLLQGLFALMLRPILHKQRRQAHAWLKQYRIHRHDQSPVRDPGDSVMHPGLTS